MTTSSPLLLKKMLAKIAITSFLIILFCASSVSSLWAQNDKPTAPPKQEPEKKQPEPEPKERTADEILDPINSKEKFTLLELSTSDFKLFIPGKKIPLKETKKNGELTTLYQLLYCLPHFNPQDIDSWKNPETPLTEIAQSPKKHQAKIYPFQGRITSYQAIEMPPHLAAQYGDQDLLEIIYRCEITQEKYNGKIIIYCLTIPKAWKDKPKLNERVSADVFLIKEGARETEPQEKQQPTLIFGATRLAWHPDTILGNAKMDVGLFDTLRNITDLHSSESDCFYQLLQTIDSLDQEKLRSSAKKFDSNYKLIEFFLKTPKGLNKTMVDPRKAKLAMIKGTALRAVKIPIVDKQIQKQYGMDHYYEVDMIVHHKPFQMVGKEKKSNPQGNKKKKPRLYTSYPVVICLRSLPKDMPIGEKIHQDVEMPAFYYKIWKTKTEFAKEHFDSPNENTLLFMGKTLTLVQKEEASSKWIIGVITAGLFLLTLAGLLFGAWYWGRGDREFHKQVVSKNYSLEQGQSLNDLGLDAQEKPDFSNLD